MKINITNKQREFILKAIYGIDSLYDFENLTEKEFLETYNITQAELKKETERLREELKKEFY